MQRLGAGSREVLELHDRTLRAAFSDGVEIRTEGDSFFMAFESAPAAVAAAVAGQRSLALAEWPGGEQVRVRMGIHTGQPEVAGDNYMGLDVHRAARIAAAAHGGQVLISGSTHALAARDLPDGVSVRDLGHHRLKDLIAPERIYQLVIPDCLSEFPAIRSLDARPNNLPTAATSFVGRAEQVGEARRLLSSTRALTLTGPGGTGKTRLALEVGALELDSFADGVFFVPLAAISDPDLVAPTVAQVLGVREEAGRSIADALSGHLRDKRLLLILDNFEQVLEGATFVAAMLEGAPGVRVVMTSRAPLRIAGEQEFPVPPLGVGSPPQRGADGPLPEALLLFAERARAVDPSFQLKGTNQADVAAICARLDGLPLAIELAAARIRILSPRAILDRLDRRLDLLAGGARDLPARQRTLRGAIDWSFGLLSPPQRSLFACASSFVGGWTFQALEAVCVDADAAEDVFETLGVPHRAQPRNADGHGRRSLRHAGDHP